MQPLGAALSEHTGDAGDPGDVALASGKVVHGFHFLAKLLGLDIQPVDPLPSGQGVQLTADESAALRRLIQRCKVAAVGNTLDHLLTAKATELEKTIISSLSSMSLQLQESTLKGQVLPDFCYQKAHFSAAARSP
jgi:hypothetical protein